MQPICVCINPEEDRGGLTIAPSQPNHHKMAETEVRTNGNGTAESDDENVSRPVDIEQVRKKARGDLRSGGISPSIFRSDHRQIFKYNYLSE